jgi:hypothetical protein
MRSRTPSAKADLTSLLQVRPWIFPAFANRCLGREYRERYLWVYLERVLPQGLFYCGLEQLENRPKTFPDIAKLANLASVDSPLTVSPADLAEVVQALARQKASISVVIDDPRRCVRTEELTSNTPPVPRRRWPPPTRRFFACVSHFVESLALATLRKPAWIGKEAMNKKPYSVECLDGTGGFWKE